MKKFFALILAVLLIFSLMLTGCNGAKDNASKEPTGTVNVYLIPPEGTPIQKPVAKYGDVPDPKYLLQELTAFVGINMEAASVKVDGSKIKVDFDDKSPLFGAEAYTRVNPFTSPKTNNELYNCILNSICKTLSENYSGAEVYFSKGGQSFTLEDADPKITIDASKAYTFTEPAPITPQEPDVEPTTPAAE
ncbi:MAG: hypothetical protein LBS74_06210 [Oscillospiraceae bacterium]|nr:hypothetical protein [Oscillospiraceae bacterium]